MLPASSILKDNILALAPTMNMIQGLTDLVGVIADFMDQVQGGPLGSPGIFKLNRPAMVAILSASTPVLDDAWVTIFANALEAGIIAAIITPATVTNPVWLGSGTKDILTLPAGAATITTVSAAKAAFKSGLMNATPTNNPPMPMAQAVADATILFIFTCIGLGPPPILPPIPIPTPAL